MKTDRAASETIAMILLTGLVVMCAFIIMNLISGMNLISQKSANSC